MTQIDRFDHSRMNLEYAGEGVPLFKLALKTTVLTIITLGFYRFWAKTRLRRYYWSAIRPGGDPFEYTGTGLEKFLGFLIAVAFLAVYLGLFNSILFFGGLLAWPFSDGEFDEIGLQIALNLSFLAVLPMIFYAQYRGRRYMLSRTRWRGIRFGADRAAWGYVWRALGHTLLTMMTLGILLPRQTYFLEKYMYDRTWYGNAKFDMIGRWQDLWPAMKHIGIGLAILLGSILSMVTGLEGLFILGAIGLSVGLIWLLIGLVHFRVKSFSIMASQKRLNDCILFVSRPRTGKVAGQYILGTFIASIIASAIIAVGSAIVAAIVRVTGFMDQIDLTDPAMLDGMAIMGWIIAGAVFYILFFALFVALSQVFITQPILEHYVSETQVINPEALNSIMQREQDDFAEAEGFAEALDVGAAI